MSRLGRFCSHDKSQKYLKRKKGREWTRNILREGRKRAMTEVYAGATLSPFPVMRSPSRSFHWQIHKFVNFLLKCQNYSNRFVNRFKFYFRIPRLDRIRVATLFYRISPEYHKLPY